MRDGKRPLGIESTCQLVMPPQLGGCQRVEDETLEMSRCRVWVHRDGSLNGWLQYLAC